MTSKSDEIVQQVQHDFQTLLVDITGSEARAQTAYTVEGTLFWRLLPWVWRCYGGSWSCARRCARLSRASPPIARA